MNTDLQWLKDLYGSQGYVFADIQAEPVFLEEPGKIDLVYHIDEGQAVARRPHLRPHRRRQPAHADSNRAQSALVPPGPDRRHPRDSRQRAPAAGERLVPHRSGQRRQHRRSPTGFAILMMSNWPTPRRRRASAARVRTDTVQPRRHQACPRQRPMRFDRQPAMLSRATQIDVHLDIETSVAAGAGPRPAGQSIGQSVSIVGGPDAESLSAADHWVLPGRSRRIPSGQATYPVTQAAGGASPATAYAANAYATNAYGGQAVRATGPESTPVGYNAQPVPPVQPVQYTEPLPPGTTFGPPPLPPAQPVGPPPGMMADPNITPLPANPQLFPSGATSRGPGRLRIRQSTSSSMRTKHRPAG